MENTSFHKILLTGDFNIKFEQIQGKEFITFLKNKYELKLLNSEEKPTTKNNTIIDGIFGRDINDIKIHNNVSYFSIHKPLILENFKLSELLKKNIASEKIVKKEIIEIEKQEETNE